MVKDRNWVLRNKCCPRCDREAIAISEHHLFMEDALLIKCRSCGVFAWKGGVCYKVDQNLKPLLDKSWGMV